MRHSNFLDHATGGDVVEVAWESFVVKVCAENRRDRSSVVAAATAR